MSGSRSPGPSGPFIVLATHNGEAFLAGQLDSLLAQTLSDWTLLVLDDHSRDGTMTLLERYAANDARIVILDRPAEPLGSPARSYGRLLGTAVEQGAQWVFCCDQDDVWRGDKLERMLSAVASHNAATPLLLHHDLEVVDRELGTVSDSYWDLMHLAPGGSERPQRLLSRNEVTGCAMACNRALLQIALPIPVEAIMHDWWLALCAGYFGSIQVLPDTLVRYRQHGENVIGARSFLSGLSPFRNWSRVWRSGNEEFLETIVQARAFRERYRMRLEDASKPSSALDVYAGILQRSRADRVLALGKYRLWRRQWLLDATLALRLLALKRKSRP